MARPSRAGATRCSWSRRCCRGTRPGAGRARPASASLRGSAPIGWTATSCTGAAAPARGDLRGLRAISSGEGKIRSWGVSNFDVADLDERSGDRRARAACLQPGPLPPGERAIEHAVIPWCEQHGVAVVAYSPFGSGHFPGPRSGGGRVLQEIAAAHGATAHQVALRFLVAAAVGPHDSQGRPAPPRRRERRGGAPSADDADLARIDAAFPRGPRPRSLPML